MFKGLYGVCTKYGHSKLDSKLNHTENIGWENCFSFPAILFLLRDDDSNDWNQSQSCRAGNAGFHQIRHHQLGYLHAQPLCRGPVTPGFGGLCCWQQQVKEHEYSSEPRGSYLHLQGGIIVLACFLNGFTDHSQHLPSFSCSFWCLVPAHLDLVDVAPVTSLLKGTSYADAGHHLVFGAYKNFNYTPPETVTAETTFH